MPLRFKFMQLIKGNLWVLFYSACTMAMAQDTTISETIDCNKVEYHSKELIRFDYNKKCFADAYPFITSDGQHLYYTSNLDGEWIYYSKKTKNDQWSKPVKINIDGFTNSIMSCYLTADLKTLFFTSESALYRCESVDGSKTHFSQVETVNIQGKLDYSNTIPFSYLSFSIDGSQMFAYCSSSTARYKRIDNNNYEFVSLSSGHQNEMGVLSENGLRYYFTIDEEPNIIFYKERSNINDAFPNSYYMFKTFESHLDIGQIRLAEKANQIVLVLSNNNWENNELYFFNTDFNDSTLKVKLLETVTEVVGETPPPASLVSPLPVIVETIPMPALLKTPLSQNINIHNQSGVSLFKIEVGTPYPNPTKSTIHFSYTIHTIDDNNELPQYVLTDNMGQMVHQGKLNQLCGEATIELPELASGAYFLRIDYKGISSPMNKIMILN